jgi:hypothetical protein
VTSPPDEQQPVDPEEAGKRLLAEQTPEHRAQARRVFERLMAGDEVDDITDLIKDFAKIDSPKGRSSPAGADQHPADDPRRPAR